MWGIGIERLKLIITATIQSEARNVTQPLTRILKTKSFLFQRQRFRGRTSMDTILSSTKYMLGNTFTQVFIKEFIYVLSYPINK